MKKYALPQRSARLVERHLGNCQHLGLILDKFQPWSEISDARGGIPNWDLTMQITEKRGQEWRPRTATGGEAKGIWLSTTRQSRNGETPSLFESFQTDMDLVNAQRDRWKWMVEQAGGIHFPLTTASRLVVGLGGGYTLETGITLDRTSGAPTIPGSTLKGLARTWALYELAAARGIEVKLELAKNKQDDEETSKKGNKKKTPLKEFEDELESARFDPRVYGDLADRARIFRCVFGTESGKGGHAGGVSFLQGVYAGDDPPRYSTDVMTPHFVDYYNSLTSHHIVPPSDDQTPNPIAFLTVDVGNLFWFGIIPRHIPPHSEAKNPCPYPTQDLLIAAGTWLQGALIELGGGGKTSAGYGYFQPFV